MQSVDDAYKLEEQKNKFIDKPLKSLLEVIGPKIVTVFGEPNGGTTGIYLLFYFINRQEYNEMTKKGEEPIGINVDFYAERNPQRKPIPQGGITNWGTEDIKAYGDMKIAKLRIIGGKKKKE